ncbi:MAG: class I SAM-dependent methyltransferase [Phycisphaerae bacterium]
MPRRYKAIAAYYDPEYAGLDYLEYDVPFLLRKMPRKPVRVLEVACGTGRAAIPLAQAGHAVVGFDYDPDLLAVARRKRDAVGLSDAELTLVHADALKLNLGRRFDWAVLLFNTFLNFTTLAEQDRLLTRTANHLEPGGKLWIDVFNPNLAMLAEEESVDLEPTAFYVPELDRSVLRVTHVKRNSSRQTQQVIFSYAWHDAEGDMHVEDNEFELTWMFPRELQLVLERHGFVVEAVYGDYKGRPVTDESERIIVQASLAKPAGVV